MAIDADTAAAALAETWQFLFKTFRAPWFRREPGVLGGLTGVPIALFNGIWAESVDPSRRTVADLLDHVSAAGLPYCAQLRPGTSAEITGELLERDMTHLEEVPLMVLEEDPPWLAATQQVEELCIRAMSPDEAPVHTGIVAGAFEIQEDLVGQLMTPERLAVGELHCYLGEVDGKPVATGLSIGLGSFAGIFNVATRTDYRGRGIGSAVTARIAADSFAAGASWVWLQSSPAGYRVYESLGFRTLERWDCWITPA